MARTAGEHLQAAQLRECAVEQHEIDLGVVEDLQRLFAVRCLQRGVAAPLQPDAHQPANISFIVDDQNRCTITFAHHTSRSCGAVGRAHQPLDRTTQSERIRTDGGGWTTLGVGAPTVGSVTGLATTAEQDAPASILVVDDHEEIVRLLAMLLTAHGYAVVVARSVAEACERYTVAVPPRLVITDVGLVDGNGAELITRLGHSAARTLFTSGRAREAFGGTSAAIPPDAAFLQKPCAPSEVLTAVHAMLAAGR